MFLVVPVELVSVLCQLTAICPGCSFCLPSWCLWRQHLLRSPSPFCSILFCEAFLGVGKAEGRHGRTLKCHGMRGGCALSETPNVCVWNVSSDT